MSDVFNAPVFNDDFKNTTPSVNVVETAENFRLDIAAPGLAKEDFKINIEDKTLTVSAEKKAETQEGDKQLRREFRKFPSFALNRSIYKLSKMPTSTFQTLDNQLIVL